MKRALVLFLVAAVLFSSGCIELENLLGGSGEGMVSGYGLVVNEFEPDFPKLESNEDFEIYLEVQNTGGSEATNVYAHLFGIETGDDGWLQGGNSYLSLGSLEPPDEVAGIPGDIVDDSWLLTTPSNPEGVVYEYKPKVRLMYDYTTSALARIPVMTKTEYKRLRERDMLPNTPINTKVSKGPLGVDVMAKTPLVIDDSDEDNMTFRVEIRTLGSGSVFNDSHSNDDSSFEVDELDIIDMKIMVSGVNDSTAGHTAKCGAYVSDDTEEGEQVSMRRGESLIYTCELPLEEFDASKNIPVTVDLTYGYFEDYSTSLSVTGVE
mgnify:CR=1 FL=1